ncbi:uncharacterized protein [Periplaneta americana]|uniref:uncharacterized protein isoform X1 n=1 Tax=Periplaneta americana TaxID=6978 RepID=UPI0037E82FAD
MKMRSRIQLEGVMFALVLRYLACAHREVRTLVYPKGATYKFNIGMGFPVDLPKKILSFSMNFQFQYTLPRNVSELREYPEIRRSLPDTVNRGTSYQAVQNVMKRYGMEGRSCLLRSICEVAEAPIYYNGLIGELLHVIFTPGYGSNMEERVEWEYHEARRRGEEGADCQMEYPQCPYGDGLLDLVSLMESYT